MSELGIALRSKKWFRADTSRVITRLFIPGQELVGGSESRTTETVQRVLALSENEVAEVLNELYERFSTRHENLEAVFEEHVHQVLDYVDGVVSAERRQLLGATFTNEFSLEGAAICNPSLVAHPDQTGVSPNGLRVILSYRCIGEGHVSSISFRTGEIDDDGDLEIGDARACPVVGTINDGVLKREVFRAKLLDAGLSGETSSSVLNSLSARFTPLELDAAIAKLEEQSATRSNVDKIIGLFCSVASCCYVASFDDSTELSQRVLWPATMNESNGMEDARFVQFQGENSSKYLASYTAYNGRTVNQQLLETDDFKSFRSSPLAGFAAKNKGLSIFPRQIAGQYVALSRHDRESNAVAFSSNLHRWNRVSTIQVPRYPWEMIQLGNCGSPIELPEGWLVINHGVGAMRTYALGALLLDLDDPTKVIGFLDRPLMLPEASERDGYVPNVVYSCGSLLHRGALYVPFGANDQAISYATVQISDLLAAFKTVV
ncbi:MAG TPA: hypothetical protein VND89_08270 [Acidimicrobiales bacterium]|nr:hypothetical protein [Acidimicrobiales bacterium]